QGKRPSRSAPSAVAYRLVLAGGGGDRAAPLSADARLNALKRAAVPDAALSNGYAATTARRWVTVFLSAGAGSLAAALRSSSGSVRGGAAGVVVLFPDTSLPVIAPN